MHLWCYKIFRQATTLENTDASKTLLGTNNLGEGGNQQLTVPSRGLAEQNTHN